MQITCPNGCHLKPNGTFSSQKVGERGDGETIFAHVCDICDEEVTFYDPEAEMDHVIYRLKRMTIAAAIGMTMLAAAVALTAYVLS